MARPKVAVVNGSLRKDSINRKLALAVAKLAADKLDLELADLAALPLYNQDLEADFPAAAARLKQTLQAADAVLFVSPEHNRSITAALKNAIDWGSRPYGQSAWPGKPGAIIGTSAGQVGTAMAQGHLKSILVGQGVALLGRPEVYFVYKEGVFDAEHNITDPQAKKVLQDFVDAFAKWVEKQTHHH